VIYIFERRDILNDPIKTLTKMDWLLWICSLAAVFLSNILPGQLDILTLAAAMIGVTSLIFAAKGNVWAQILMIVFSILYGIISYRFRYWGEMVTYLGMTLPMAVWSMITWIRNPSAENDSEVEIQRLNRKHIVGLVIFTAAVTVVFYYTLKALGTPNMVFSTISVTTSFLAASLTMLRSSYYALGYAANDIVLIVLWILASLKDPSYIPVAVNFSIFFLNDMYGFISWKKREIRQAQTA
jgi:nicotinamide mononucleotide transporter